MTPEDLQGQVRSAIGHENADVVALARDVHAHPQLAFAEEYAAARVGEHLQWLGFQVQRGVFGMPTAFVASYGNGPLHVAFCAEYDALPPTALSDRAPKEFVGLVPVDTQRPSSDVHACGHNLITGAAVAAAAGLRGLAAELGLRISVFGTPGEELIGLPDPPPGRYAAGKAVFVQAGAFDDAHAAFMVHPFPTPYGAFIPNQIYGRRLADFSRAGEGAQPLDGAPLQQFEADLTKTVNDRRQNLLWCRTKPQTTEHGPHADLLWIGPSPEEVRSAGEAVERVLRTTAAAQGLTVTVTAFAENPQLRNDPFLAASYRRHAQTLGRHRQHDAQVRQEIAALRKLTLRGALRHPSSLPGLLKAALHPPVGLFYETYPVDVVYGTDMSDVSQVIPAIHPFIGIGGFTAPHSVGFTSQADGDPAYQAMTDAAVALAWTAIDAATDPTLKAHLLSREAP
jgi:metal-dependent amidase/aminoacylase/carboxypeptidase family protein